MGFGNNRGGYKQQKPKPQLPELEPQHDLDPVIKAVIQQADRLQPFNQGGDMLPTEMIRFDTLDGKGVTMEAYKAMMITNLTFAVPHDNSCYPRVAKLKTVFDRAVLYAAYASRIFWNQSKDFWHIPGFSRYVINKDGLIKNAFNGIDIKPNQWGSYALFCDGFYSAPKPRQVTLPTLMLMSQKALPQDFKDFGYMTYNYTIGYKSDIKAIDFVKRPAVQVKAQDGSIEEAENAHEFAKIFMNHKQHREFLTALNEDKLYYGSDVVAGFTVKLKDQSLLRQIPQVAPVQQAPAQPVTQQAPVQQSMQEQQPATQQQTPAYMDQTIDADIDF